MSLEWALSGMSMFFFVLRSPDLDTAFQIFLTIAEQRVIIISQYSIKLSSRVFKNLLSQGVPAV